jgi:hypothetical protein
VSAGEWTALFEELLRGLVHAMNNRVTALSAFAELAAMDGESVETAVLRQEITRLHMVTALVGVMATRGTDTEALELRGVLEQALTIHSHHPRMRAAACTIAQTGLMLPVRVPRWALLRLLLLMVDTAKRAGETAGVTAVEARLAGDEATLTVQVASVEGLALDAAALATICGGTLRHAAGNWVLELPSLLALRRRERSLPA